MHLSHDSASVFFECGCVLQIGILNAARILGLVFQGNDRENRRIMSSRAAFTDHRKHDEKGGTDGAHIATRDKVSDKTLGYDCAIKAVMEGSSVIGRAAYSSIFRSIISI